VENTVDRRTLLTTILAVGVLSQVNGCAAASLGGQHDQKNNPVDDIVVKRPWADVRAFGAIGDGSTDDSLAFQKAIDYAIANRCILFIPSPPISPNQYLMGGSKLNISGPIHILGAGAGPAMSRLVWTKPGGGFSINSDSVVIENITLARYPRYSDTTNNDIAINSGTISQKNAYHVLSNLFIDGFYTPISVTRLWHSEFHNIETVFGKHGILIYGTSVNNFVKGCKFLCDASRNSYGIGFVDPDNMTEGWVIDGNLTYKADIGVYGIYTHNVKIINNILDFCETRGVFFIDGTGFSSNIDILNNYIAIQGDGVAAIQVDTNSSNLQVRGNRIVTNQVLTYPRASLQRGIHCSGKTNANNIIMGNTIRGCSLCDIQNDKLSITMGNVCLSTTTANGYNISSPGVVSDNIGIVHSMSFSGISKLGQMTQTRGETSPTSGTWQQGDLCWSNKPSLGSNIGWVCTVGGNPGRWEKFGIVG
jgi:hypothetical protein